MKAEYKFYSPINGSVIDLIELEKLLNEGKVTQEYYDNRLEKADQVLESQKDNERTWRNSEYTATDWMFSPDATYANKQLKDSPELQEILQYRAMLKEYDLKYQPRPIRPTWFK